MGDFVKFLLFILNIIMALVVGTGIYAFSQSALMTIILTLIITGTSVAFSPITALLAYPLVEWYFNDSLTIYSAITVGIITFEILIVIICTRFRIGEEEYYGE